MLFPLPASPVATSLAIHTWSTTKNTLDWSKIRETLYARWMVFFKCIQPYPGPRELCTYLWANQMTRFHVWLHNIWVWGWMWHKTDISIKIQFESESESGTNYRWLVNNWIFEHVKLRVFIWMVSKFRKIPSRNCNCRCERHFWFQTHYKQMVVQFDSMTVHSAAWCVFKFEFA